MPENDRIEVIDTSALPPPTEADNLYISRKNAYDTLLPGEPEATVFVVAYNRLEKTKRCVASILKYTGGIDYELLLIDNGSEDDTLEYFQIGRAHV